MPGTTTTVSSQTVPGFTFSGLVATLTKIEVSASAAQTDVSHLGCAVASKRLYRAAPLSDSPEVKVDFIGNSIPAVGTKAAFTLTGVFLSTKAAECTKAVCTAASLKATVGDLVKGSATFKLSKT